MVLFFGGERKAKWNKVELLGFQIHELTRTEPPPPPFFSQRNLSRDSLEIREKKTLSEFKES